jgi:hypothetical protein
MDIPLRKISAASSEISAENPVKIARTSRKIAAANRIAQILVRQDKSIHFDGFAKKPSVLPRRRPPRNGDASDSHRRIRFECDLDRDVYSVLTSVQAGAVSTKENSPKEGARASIG